MCKQKLLFWNAINHLIFSNIYQGIKLSRYSHHMHNTHAYNYVGYNIYIHIIILLHSKLFVNNSNSNFTRQKEICLAKAMNEWMNESFQQTHRRCPPPCSDVTGRAGGGGVIWKDLNVLQRVIKTSYLHHFCSIGTGSARRSPAPRRTPHRTSWSPSVWSTSLARVCPASSPPPPPIWLQWRLIWARRWGSH